MISDILVCEFEDSGEPVRTESWLLEDCEDGETGAYLEPQDTGDDVD